jgi:hypothetical protein
MDLILSTILKSYYVPAKWVVIDYDAVASNPSPKLTKWLINNFDKLTLPYQCETLNEGLIIHFIDYFKVLMPNKLIRVEDPRAAPAIIEIISRGIGRLTPLHIRDNPNPGLTKFLIDSGAELSGNSNPALTKTIIERNYRERIESNTNPELAEFIIKYLTEEDEFYAVFSNPNPGLTNFIMEKYEDDYLPPLVRNTNPLLAEFILSKDYDKSLLRFNSNPGLTEAIIENTKGDRDLVDDLKSNTNPKLLDIIGDLYDGNLDLCTNPIIAKRKLISIQ